MLKRLTSYSLMLLGLYLLVMLGCTSAPPRNQNNVCSIFRQYPEWYWSTVKTEHRWGVPISVQMSIVYQESHFQATAKPSRTKLLWLIPWKRPTTAYGYSQALDGTWSHYKTHTGNQNAGRDTFSDAVDFIGWYANRAYQRLGIARGDARDLYLAYHEGLGGYSTATYLQKPWLIQVANKVKLRADIYNNQLAQCRKSLPNHPWWRLW